MSKYCFMEAKDRPPSSMTLLVYDDDDDDRYRVADDAADADDADDDEDDDDEEERSTLYLILSYRLLVPLGVVTAIDSGMPCMMVGNAGKLQRICVSSSCCT